MKTPELKDIKSKIRKHLDVLQNTYHVKTIGVFGSFAKKGQTKKSDIDILVAFSKPVGFFHFIHTEDYLKRILRKKIDMVTVGGLKPEIKATVLHQVRYI